MTHHNEHIEDRFLRTIKNLHSAKNRAYGDSWKRRGEVISIIANIARKIDRLERYNEVTSAFPDDTLLDTLVDLFAYTIKYITYLEHSHPLIPDGSNEGDRHVNNFDKMVDDFEGQLCARRTISKIEAIASVIDEFGRLESLFSDAQPTADVAERLLHTRQLAEATAQAIASVRQNFPAAASEFVDRWT